MADTNRRIPLWAIATVGLTTNIVHTFWAMAFFQTP